MDRKGLEMSDLHGRRIHIARRMTLLSCRGNEG
jgi:hypothetical protein